MILRAAHEDDEVVVVEDDDDTEMLRLEKMRKLFEKKPKGFGEGKVYDTSLEDKLLEELQPTICTIAGCFFIEFVLFVQTLVLNGKQLSLTHLAKED
ncbi:hypothetical protein RIF29_15408 [Crotalaria pallida]|uniref:Uncharacterized protein n=1 Tax=Crotalaria pallida TaxID=3830 RepID=A0AAN9FET2_CROPI